MNERMDEWKKAWMKFNQSIVLKKENNLLKYM